MEVKYYTCIKEVDNNNNNNENAFLTYAFGNGGNYGSRYSYSINSYYDYTTQNECFFHTNWIYQSIDNGKTITDDCGSIWDLEPIKDYFKEIKIEFDDCVKTLIQLKTKKGNRIDIKPSKFIGDKILYHVDCAAISKRSYVSTWSEGTDAYETIVHCFKTLRTGNFNSYYQKIKDVLEKQNS